MKISIEWLREYIDLEESPALLSESLTMMGLVVESVEDLPGGAVLEIEVTSNRPDCLSYAGIARELAARYERPLKKIPLSRRLRPGRESIPYSIEILDPDLCPRYAGLVLSRIRVAPSPGWMQQRLEASGIRPVNNIVDITNYVLLELGHPLHAFDFEKLRQGRIVVGRAGGAKRFTTLDGIERDLDADMLMINDGAGPVAVAGVMGGLDSEITGATRTVLLECAYFSPSSIRKTSRKLGLSTEASYRFERGADWNAPVRAIARTCYLLRRLAGGRVAGELQDVYPRVLEPVRIELHRSRAERLLGVPLQNDFVETVLKKLEFKSVRRGKGRWLVQCPTYRADMELEADLIEEVARFYGYQNIPVTAAPAATAGESRPGHHSERTARRILLGLGYSEGVNLSFAAEADHRLFPPREGHSLEIRNPLTEDTRFMRTSLIPGLVQSAKRNFNHGAREIRLFEIGRVYGRVGGNPAETNMLGILGTGGFAGQNWHHPSGGYDFFHLKGVVNSLLRGMRSPGADVVPAEDVPWLNPADASALVVDGRSIGLLGSLSAALADEFKMKQPVYLAEIDFGELARLSFLPITYVPAARYPAVERDMSIIVNNNTTYGAVRSGILGLGIPELTALELMDIYEGDQVPSGKLSMTLRLTFQDRERTLTVDRVQGFSDNIRTFLRDHYGADFR